MKTAVIPQIRVEPELRAELESVLKEGETLTGFVEVTVRNAIAFRRVQTTFHERAQAASAEYHRTGVSAPVDAVLDKLQSKLNAKRKRLGR
jgi:ribosome-associated translation inhibitor RaiA